LIKSQTLQQEQAAEAIPYEAGLLMELKDIRLKIAMRENAPAYIILSDATLLEIATYLPADLHELRQISGFGDVKMERYGQEFSGAVVKYNEQHGLSSRMSKKSPKRERKAKTGRTSATQVESLNLYKSGLSIPEIAHERQLSPMTIESHLCQFVQSGELDVLELVAESKIATIKDTVESYGHERLAPLKEILGDDYTYTEIKAVIAWMQRAIA
jgi:ATP-dependent DNA helicase RecQ